MVNRFAEAPFHFKSRLDPRQTNLYVSSNDVIKQDSFSVLVYSPESDSTWDVTEFVKNLTYKSDERTGYATIRLLLRNHVTIRHVLTPPNWVIWNGPYWSSEGPAIEPVEAPVPGLEQFEPEYQEPIISPYEEIDRGIIVDVAYKNADASDISVTAKDPTWFLTKNSVPYRLPNATLTDRLAFLEQNNYINLRHPLLKTEHVIKASRGGEGSIYRDITYDINETNRAEGARYLLRHRKGRHYLYDPVAQRNLWAFEYGHNIMDSILMKSMEGYYNRVYVLQNQTGVDDPLIPLLADGSIDFDSENALNVGFAENEEDQAIWGLQIASVKANISSFQPTLAFQAFDTLQRTNKLEETVSINTWSVPGVEVGDGVLLYDPINNLAGVYFVRALQHTIGAAKAVMKIDADLDSSWTSL